MSSKRTYGRREFLSYSGGALAAVAARQTFCANPSSKQRGLVVGLTEANEAGNAVLADGGNAVDAIIAGALVAGVVAVSRCGIGGYGGHMIIGLPRGEGDSPIFASKQEKIGTVPGRVTCIDFNSEAPAAARPDMFPVDAKGNVKGNINSTGWLAAGVPGTMAGLQLALEKYGSKPFAQLVQPAIRYAREGFPMNFIRGLPYMRQDPGSAKLFFPGGKPLVKGKNYRNPDLADLLQKLAEKGSVDDFYHGEIARQIASAFQKNGGLVTERDLANYRALEVPPLDLEWRGHTIVTAPLTAGGLTILQTIATLKAMANDWEKLPPGPARIQARLETMRIAWGDRLNLFGDPKFVHVPIERLLSEKYAQESAKKVRAAVAERRPVPISIEGRTGPGTLNLSAADGNGMMACVTFTHGNSFGAQVTVEGLGLLLGHGMSRFDPVPDRPNSIAPGKRPLDNMSPTIVLKGGKPMMAVGAAGGRRIVNGVLETIFHRIGGGLSLAEAMAQPRLHTEGDLTVHAESGRPEAEIQYLKKIGYTVRGPQQCYVSAVERDPTKPGGQIVGVADNPPTRPREARDRHPTVTRAG
jgi:gamma-glutamyltranspeptidase / glutathione hydrolase